MLIPSTIIQLITVISGLFALLGVILVAYTTYNAGKRMDNNIVRARAFLSESFLKESWKLLFMVCLFLLLHVGIELNEIFGLFIEPSIPDLIKEITELGIIVCIDISTYKWFKLMNPK
jgi:hypothetical protein